MKRGKNKPVTEDSLPPFQERIQEAAAHNYKENVQQLQLRRYSEFK